MKFGVAFRTALIGLSVLGGAISAAAQPVQPPPLEAYGELPSVEEIVLSPSGTHFATLNSVDGERMIMVFDDGGRLISRMKTGDMKIRDLEFVSDDLLLATRNLTEDLGYGFTTRKAEMFQALILPIELNKIDLVFGNRRDLISAIFGHYGIRWVDGKPKAYFGAVELVKTTGGRGQYEVDHTRPALYEVDLETNSVRQIAGAPREGVDRDWLVGDNGSILAVVDRSLTDGEWVIRNYYGDVLASGKNPTGRAYLVSVGADGTTIIYASPDEADEGIHWYEVPVDASAPPTEFLPDKAIERLYRDRRNGRLIGYLQDEGTLEPVFFDPKKESRVRAARRVFASLNPRLGGWTDSMGRVIIETNGNDDSGTFYFVDLEEGKASPIMKSRPDIGAEAVGAISTFEYAASDGLEMNGILTLPPGREPTKLPLVMLPHGGPHSQDTARFHYWAQAFASRGYAVFQPNFRGSTNRDQAFTRAGYGEWGKKMQTDVSDGLAALAEKGIIDPARACIVGASYGGYAALAGVTLQQGIYRCAVSVNGVADVSLMSRSEIAESGRVKIVARSLERQLGPQSGHKDISPRYHANEANAPILLIHGRDDTVVNFDQSTKMADALKDAGKPYEFLELEGEDHWLSLGETRKAMLKATLEFVQRHNPPD